MTPKAALLHIGTPKTGTTSIQECLTSAEAAGDLGRYRYPLVPGDRNHNRLLMLYLPHADQPSYRQLEFPRDGARFQRARRKYRRFIFGKLRTSEGAIISGEQLFSLKTSAALELRRDLESLGFRQFHIVLYVRDPADFYLSRAQQMLKLPVHAKPAVIDPISFRYPFRSIAESWERAFPDRVIVRPYSSAVQYDVIADFSEVMQRCLGMTLPRASGRLNATVSAEAMVVLQEYRQAVGTDESGLRFPGLDHLVAFLVRSGQCTPQTPPMLKAAVAEQIRTNHSQDAEFLHSRYGVELGLGPSAGTQRLADRSSWRVEDILESADPEIIQRLREEFAGTVPSRRRSLPVRAAAWAYRAAPYSLRPARLDALLRSRFSGRPQG